MDTPAKQWPLANFALKFSSRLCLLLAAFVPKTSAPIVAEILKGLLGFTWKWKTSLKGCTCPFEIEILWTFDASQKPKSSQYLRWLRSIQTQQSIPELGGWHDPSKPTFPSAKIPRNYYVWVVTMDSVTNLVSFRDLTTESHQYFFGKLPLHSRHRGETYFLFQPFADPLAAKLTAGGLLSRKATTWVKLVFGSTTTVLAIIYCRFDERSTLFSWQNCSHSPSDEKCKSVQ